VWVCSVGLGAAGPVAWGLGGARAPTGRRAAPVTMAG
jgi:hypothetical protein